MSNLCLLFSLLIFPSLAVSLNGQGQAAQISTRIFNARDGLPDNKVQYLLETRKSPFRWAVTHNELCRFDGYRFQTVWKKMHDINGFAENSRGELVVCNYHPGQKISVFQPESGQKETRTVDEIPGLKGQLVRMWAQDTMVFLAMQTEMGRKVEVYRMFPGFSVQHLFGVPLSADIATNVFPPPGFIPLFRFDEKSQAFWYSGAFFGKGSAAYRFDLKTGQSTIIAMPALHEDAWPGFLEMPDGSMLAFSSEQNEVLRWNESVHNFEKINQKPGPLPGLELVGADKKGAAVFKRTDSGQKDLWLLFPDGTWLDLKKMLPGLTFTSCSGADFSRQIHFCTLEGVLRVNFEHTLFKKFVPSKQGDLISPAFRGITADPEGNVWLMGEMIGAFCFRPDGSIKRAPVLERNSGQDLITDSALNLQTDAEGKIWSAREVTRLLNLLRFDPKTGLADTFHIKNQRISAFTLLKNGSASGKILLAANGEKTANLLLFDPATRQVSVLASAGENENFKTAPIFLLENPDGNVWVGGKEGLLLFDPNLQITKSTNPRFLDFAGNDTTAHEFPVAVIFQENQNLWVGTLGGGLRKLNLKTGKWEIFTMANGLPANKIAGILPGDPEGPGGNLWVSTYDGLSFFQPEAKLFTNFFTQNGLSHNEFNRFSFFKNHDGTMFFGGLNGVNFFKPSEVLGSFSLGSDSLLISQISWFAPDGKTNMEQFFDLQNLKKITLPPENRFCSIRLALTNYLQPEANRFAWKLDGHDDDWHLNGTNNEITFHYLPAGKYLLRIKAANPTGVWGKNERTIEIEVREFWYKTWWFLALFIAAAAFFSYLYYRHKIRQKLEQVETAKIRELDLLRSRLYTNITHEFRTPLTIIMGMLDNIRGFDNERGLIRRNSNNLLRLINQLLDLSKLDSGTMKMDLVQSDIIQYLRYLSESFYSMASEKKIGLTFSSDIPELVMDYDEVKIQHIMYNLLSNALKFTKPGGSVALLTSPLENNGQPVLSLRVSDTGIGIPEDQLAHIFDRFYQADSSHTRKGEGTGIGLTLTKELVEMMGGSIAVASSPGEGSTFTLLFPVRLGADTPKPTQASPLAPTLLPDMATVADSGTAETSPVHLESPDTDKPVLLLIEDNADVVMYIVSLLKKEYEIHTAPNGLLGIERALEIIPDIIISDVMLPEMDGYEVCETLKKDERTSHIPIILLTAKAAESDRITGLRMGADAYLMKPFNKEELFVRLEKLLELRRVLQNKYARWEAVSMTEVSSTLEDSFLRKMRLVVEEHLDDPNFDVPQLCQAAHLSNMQVNRKLKALTDKTPSRFIRSVRLHKAKELLQSTELNISEIAYDVGFSDPNYFSRSFSEEFGVPPVSLRK